MSPVQNKHTIIIICIIALILGALAIGYVDIFAWRSGTRIQTEAKRLVSTTEGAHEELLLKEHETKFARREALPIAELTPAASNDSPLKVIVRTLEGAVVPGMPVLMHAVSSDPRSWWRVKETDTSGVAHFETPPTGYFRAYVPNGDSRAIIRDRLLRQVLEFQLPKKNIMGRVLTESGAPQDGALVFAKLQCGAGVVNLPMASTDANGYFSSISPSKPQSWFAQASGVGLSAEQRIGSSSSHIEFHLIEGTGGVRINVTGMNGPVQGAEANVEQKDSPPTRFSACTVSERDGRIEILGLPHSKYRCTVTAPGYAPWVENVRVSTLVVDLNVQLRAGCTVTGQVVNTESVPEPGIDVHIRGFRGRSAITAITNKDGEFNLVDVPADRVVTVEAIPRNASVEEGVRKVLRNPRDVSPVHLVLPQRHAFYGRVVALSGRPMTGWRISLMPLASIAQREYIAETDEDGKFRIDNIAPPPWQVSFFPSNSILPVEIGDFGQDAVGGDFRVIQQEVCDQVRGRVVDAPSGAAADALIIITGENGVARVAVEASEAGGGHFAIGPIPYGRYKLYVDTKEGVRQKVRDLIVNNATMDLGDVRVTSNVGLEVELKGATIKDIRGVRALAYRGGELHELHRDGEVFVGSGLPPGEYRIIVLGIMSGTLHIGDVHGEGVQKYEVSVSKTELCQLVLPENLVPASSYARLQIRTATGEVVVRFEFLSHGGVNEISLDLPDGIYRVVCEDTSSQPREFEIAIPKDVNENGKVVLQ